MKIRERDATEDDVKNWPSAIVGQPVGGAGSPGNPPKNRPDKPEPATSFDDQVKRERDKPK